MLDKSWNTKGGCGWQTRGAGATGGIWHTGSIELTTLACNAQCELVDIIAGFNGILGQWEMLVTPAVEKVNRGLDADGDPTHRLEITNWAWNMEIDLVTELDLLLWELDTDTQSVTRADLFNDSSILNFIGGTQARSRELGSPGSQVFAPFSGTTSVNGTAGNNRVGKNACIFENAGSGKQADNTLGFASPRTASDGTARPTAWATPTTTATPSSTSSSRPTAPSATSTSPRRTDPICASPPWTTSTATPATPSRARSVSGSRRDSPGDPGRQAGYGVGVDDMVIEWREVALIKDVTDCANGACATLSLDVTNAFEAAGCSPSPCSTPLPGILLIPGTTATATATTATPRTTRTATTTARSTSPCARSPAESRPARSSS